MRRKFLSVLLALTMVLSLLPTTVFATVTPPTLNSLLTVAATGDPEVAAHATNAKVVTLDYGTGYTAAVDGADAAEVTLGESATVWSGQTLKLTAAAFVQAVSSNVTLTIKDGANVVLVSGEGADAEQYVFASAAHTQKKGYFLTSQVDTTFAIASTNITYTFAGAEGATYPVVTTKQGTETAENGGVVSNGYYNSGMLYSAITINEGVSLNVEKGFNFDGEKALTNNGTITVAQGASFLLGRYGSGNPTLTGTGTVNVNGEMLLADGAELNGTGTINVNNGATLNVKSNGGDADSSNVRTVNVRSGGTLNFDGTKIEALVQTNLTKIVINSGATVNYGAGDAIDAVNLIGTSAPATGKPFLSLGTGATLTLAKGDSKLLATLAGGTATVPKGNYWISRLGAAAYDLAINAGAALDILSGNGDGGLVPYGFTVAGALTNKGTITIADKATMGVLEGGSVANSGSGALIVNGTAYVDNSGVTANFTEVGASGKVYAVTGASSVTVENGTKATVESAAYGGATNYVQKWTAAQDILHFNVAQQTFSWWNSKTTADFAASDAITFEKAAAAPDGYVAKWNVTGTLKSADATTHMGQAALRYDNFLPMAMLMTDGASANQASTTWARVIGKSTTDWCNMNDTNLVGSGDKGLGILMRVNDLTGNTGLADGTFKVEVVTGAANAEAAAAATEKEVYLIDVTGVKFERNVKVTVKQNALDNAAVSGATVTLTGGTDIATGKTEAGGTVSGGITTTLGAASTTYTASVSGYTVNKIVVTRKDAEGETIGSAVTTTSAPFSFALSRYNADQVEVEIFVTAAADASGIGDPTFTVITGTKDPVDGSSTSVTASSLLDTTKVTPSITYASTSGKVKTYNVAAELKYISEYTTFSSAPLNAGHYLAVAVSNPGIPSELQSGVSSNAKFALVGALKRGDWGYSEIFADGNKGSSTSELSCYTGTAADVAILVLRVDDVINGATGTNNSGKGYVDFLVNWSGATGVGSTLNANTITYRLDLSGVKLQNPVAKADSSDGGLGEMTFSYKVGEVTTDNGTNVPQGATVTVNVADNEGKTASGIELYKDKAGSDTKITNVAITAAGSGKWTFTMPNYPVYVKASAAKVGYAVNIATPQETISGSAISQGTVRITKVVAGSNTYTSLSMDTVNNTTVFPLSKWDGKVYAGEAVAFTLAAAPASGYSLSSVDIKADTGSSTATGSSFGSEIGGTYSSNAISVEVGSATYANYHNGSGIWIVPTFTKANLSVTTDAASSAAVTLKYSSTSATDDSAADNLSEEKVGDTTYVYAAAATGYTLAGKPVVSGVAASDITADSNHTIGGTSYNVWHFTMPASNVTVSINATETDKTITYNMNGVGAQPSNAPTKFFFYQVDGTKTVDIPNPAAVTGYTFGGWTTDSSLTSPAPSTSFKLNSSNATGALTLYAKWVATDTTLSSVTESNGATIQQSGSAYTLTVPSETASVTFTAAATAGAKATVEAELTTAATGASVASGDSTASSITPTVTLATAAGSTTNVTITVTAESGATATYTLAITKAPANQYAINAESVSNGSIALSASTAIKGATVTVTPTPATGYEMTQFVVGYTAADNSPKTVTVSSGTTFTMPSDIKDGTAVTVTATFAQTNYAVKYDLNGGVWSFDASTAATNKTTAEAMTYTYSASTNNVSGIPNPVREGYKFMGWQRPALNGATPAVVTATTGPAAVDLAGYTGDVTLTARWQVRSSDVTIKNGGSDTYVTIDGKNYPGYAEGNFIYFPAPDENNKVSTATFKVTATQSGKTGATTAVAGSPDTDDNAVITSGSQTSSDGVLSGIPYSSNIQITVTAPSGTTRTYTLRFLRVYALTTNSDNVAVGQASDGNRWDYWYDSEHTTYYFRTGAKFRVIPAESYAVDTVKIDGEALPVDENGNYSKMPAATTEIDVGATVNVTVTVAAPEIEAEAVVDTTNMSDGKKANINAVQDRIAEIGLTAGTGDTDGTSTVTEAVTEVLGNTAVIDDLKEAATNVPAIADAVEANPDKTLAVNIEVTPTFDIKVDAAKSSDTKVTIEIEPVVLLKPTAKLVDAEGNESILDTDIGAVKKPLEVTAPQSMSVPISNTLADTAVAGKLTVKHTKDDGRVYYYTGTVTGDTDAYYLDFVNPNGFSTFEISAAAAPVRIGTTNYATLQQAIDAVANGDTIVLTSSYTGASVAKIAEQWTSAPGSTVAFTINTTAASDTVKADFAANYASRVVAGTSKVTGYDIVATDSYPAQAAENLYNYSFGLAISDSEAPAASPVTPAAPAAGGGGGSTVKNVSVTVNDSKGGTVTATPASVTIKVNEGYKIAKITVKGAEVTIPANGVITGLKSSDVVAVTFEKEAAPAATSFIDVVPGSFYEAAVKWAVEKGVTNGKDAVDTFKPNDTCTRAEAVTFLYRAAGSPEVEVTAAFKDVAADAYYAKAVAWAVANGITNGKNELDTFLPNDVCSRAEIVTFLARYEKAAAGDASAFTDVNASEWYAGSVGWAVANGITNGKDAADTFKPADSCTRAEIVTFLYRDMVK